MKNTNLSKLIKDRLYTRLDRTAVFGKSRNLTYSELTKLSLDLNDEQVVLYISDITLLISIMTLLDGSVRTLCPISTLIDKSDLIHLLSLHKFNTVVSDKQTADLDIFMDRNINFQRVAELSSSNKSQQNFSGQDTTWLIPTSGTTSKPKLVKHTIKSLTASAIKTKNEYKEPQVWGLFYDITRYAGYQTLFNSLLNGHSLVVPPHNQTINEKVETCIKRCVTHISATPTLWRKILMSKMSSKIPLKSIVLGGEAADQPTLDALKKYFPDAKITHVYASTEAGLGISVSDGLAGFPMHFLKNSKATTDIAIRKDHLFLRSPSTALGYEDEADLKDMHGWVDTGDLVKIEGNRFFVIGRANGTINIGGDKVNPNNIRHMLLEHPDVLEARVYGKKSPLTGMLLLADVQLYTNIDEEAGKKSIMTFINEKLQPKDRPRIVYIVNEIHTDITGKIGQR